MKNEESRMKNGEWRMILFNFGFVLKSWILKKRFTLIVPPGADGLVLGASLLRSKECKSVDQETGMKRRTKKGTNVARRQLLESQHTSKTMPVCPPRRWSRLPELVSQM